MNKETWGDVHPVMVSFNEWFVVWGFW